MEIKHGQVWWSELNTRDAEKASAFYAKLMGWTPYVSAMADIERPAQPGEPSYTTMMQGETPICGVFDLALLEGMENVPAHWMTYIAVDDVDASCKQIKELGGCVIREGFDVAKVGRIAIVQDPTGAVFGIGKPVARPDCPEAA
ncbi:MAG: VOC family protein [Alphaproteobacteria bacterium]|nr:VOC family protein [Alphaproteobacteria bacterium]